jgi:hypothetical protein
MGEKRPRLARDFDDARHRSTLRTAKGSGVSRRITPGSILVIAIAIQSSAGFFSTVETGVSFRESAVLLGSGGKVPSWRASWAL